ncbi:hypothetical protein EDB84DRAFT_1482346 [Lactarius hengduanensis]|nr:hypothetical protein EDB84DRAFT_1482346 [Lactarius hengduanensis]
MAGLGVPSPFFSVWDWHPGVLVHMFRVLTVLLSRALRGGPIPIGARFHSCGTGSLVLGCDLEDVDQRRCVMAFDFVLRHSHSRQRSCGHPHATNWSVDYFPGVILANDTG